MNSFEYASAKSLQEAIQLLGPDSAILAGGTDLLSLIKDGVLAPSRLVNIKEIPDLGDLLFEEKHLQLGALVTLRQLSADERVANAFPSLAQAAEGVRSPQIQAMGTVGGDLCQRPRCWYYRNGHGLLALDQGRSLVLEGDSRYHAILGNGGPAYFVNASGLAPPLMALGARLLIEGPAGQRQIQLEEFYATPQNDQEREYKLEANEIVTAIQVPRTGNPNATYEVRQKASLDWPLASASVSLQMNGDTVSKARIVMGAVAPVPWLSVEAAQSLEGQRVDAESAERAGFAATRKARALTHNKYKIRLAQVAVKRAILRAAGREV